MSRVALALLLVLIFATAGWARLSGLEGHPRSRFPLAVWVEPFDDVFEQVAGRVIEDWNALTLDVLAMRVFARVEARQQADITIDVGPRRTVIRSVGAAKVRAGVDRQIEVPLRIRIFGPPAGVASVGIDRETRLSGVIAHELGHALGLPHVDDRRSLMCCGDWRATRHDRAMVAAYWETRRRPDVRSVRDQLAAHYAAFWMTEVP